MPNLKTEQSRKWFYDKDIVAMILNRNAPPPTRPPPKMKKSKRKEKGMTIWLYSLLRCCAFGKWRNKIAWVGTKIGLISFQLFMYLLNHFLIESLTVGVGIN